MLTFMKVPCSGVILAGGRNTRFSGKDKAFLTVGAVRIIDRLLHLFKELFDEVILVTNDPLKYLEWDVYIVTDLFPLRSSLTGIHAGLFHAASPYAFFSACDTPFLKKELVETIVDTIESNVDIVIPETAKGMEPLCAAYSQRCLLPITQHLEKNQLKIQSIFNKARIRTLQESALRKIDPDLTSFYNINTPGDLARAEEIMVSQHGFEPHYRSDKDPSGL